MMLTAGLAYDANLPTQGLVARFHEIDVLVDRHDFISITDNREDGDLCFGNRSEVVHWVLVIGERLFLRKPINFQQRLPIALGAGADTLAARPALEVADRRVHIEPGDAVGVKRGPVDRARPGGRGCRDRSDGSRERNPPGRGLPRAWCPPGRRTAAACRYRRQLRSSLRGPAGARTRSR